MYKIPPTCLNYVQKTTLCDHFWTFRKSFYGLLASVLVQCSLVSSAAGTAWTVSMTLPGSSSKHTKVGMSLSTAGAAVEISRTALDSHLESSCTSQPNAVVKATSWVNPTAQLSLPFQISLLFHVCKWLTGADSAPTRKFMAKAHCMCTHA